MILMALRTRMRQGELKGPEWRSSDLVNSVVIAQRSYCNLLQPQEGHRNCKEQTKENRTPNRYVVDRHMTNSCLIPWRILSRFPLILLGLQGNRACHTVANMCPCTAGCDGRIAHCWQPSSSVTFLIDQGGLDGACQGGSTSAPRRITSSSCSRRTYNPRTTARCSSQSCASATLCARCCCPKPPAARCRRCAQHRSSFADNCSHMWARVNICA